MREIKNDYKKITKIALSYGLEKTVREGIYDLNGQEIDLTESGDNDLAVAKNIIDQISFWVNR